MRLLITGGAGEIGEFIVEELKNKHDLIIFDLKEPKNNEINFIKGNLTDLQALEKATKDVDAIIHLAAYRGESLIPSYPEGWDVNVTGTFNVFEAAVRNGVKKVISASSICAPGLLTWVSSNHSIDYFPIDEKHVCKPEDLYGTGKLILEKLAWMYSKRSNVSFINLRLATVWIEYKKGINELTKWFIDNLIKDPTRIKSIDLPMEMPDKKGHVIQDPKAFMRDLVWQFVDARDVAQAFRLALEKKDEKFGIYNIGASNTPSTWDSIKLAKYIYPDVQIKNSLTFLVDRKKALWDISKAQRELGYQPEFNWEAYKKYL